MDRRYRNGDIPGFVLHSTSLPLPTNYTGEEGGSVSLSTSSSSSSREQATRPLTSAISADSGDTLYFSAEAQPNTYYSNSLFGLAADTALSKRIQAGFSGNTGNMRAYLLVTDGTGSHIQVLTPDDAASDIGRDPKFYVTKIVTHTDGSVDAFMKYYANTDVLPTAEPATWDLQITGVTGLAGLSYDYLSITGVSYSNYGGEGCMFDEFRIGETWGDVVPTVPEPSTLVLLASGLIGLLAYAWRKRNRNHCRTASSTIAAVVILDIGRRMVDVLKLSHPSSNFLMHANSTV